MRKPHSKSRKGCVPCKRRHVKCDEATPICGACGRLGIACTWPKTNNRTTESPSAGTPSSAGISSSSELAVADLQLLAFWIRNTSTTLSTKATQHVWQEEVVDLAFHHHFILHGILGTAAIHKAGLYPEESESLFMQSTAHMDVAIGVLREKVETQDPSSAVAVFAMSGMLVVHSLGLAQLRPPVEPLTDLCHWIRLMHGQKATVQQNWVRLLTSEMAPIMLSIDLTPKSGPVAEVLRLKDLIAEQQVEDPAIQEAYAAAIDQLHAVFVNVHYHMKTGQMFAVAITMTWAATLPRIIIDLLLSGDQVSLILFAHFAVLFRLQESSWWMKGWASWTLEAIRPQVHPDNLHWIEWPIAQLENH